MHEQERSSRTVRQAALVALILFLLAVGAPAAIQNVRVVTTTATQAVIPYAPPPGVTCQVEVSESETLRPLVPDVDPALFPGADLDNRQGTTSLGSSRLFVIGRHGMSYSGSSNPFRAADGSVRSRALQAATTHYFRISCGSDIATGSFVTANVPLGKTFGEPLPIGAPGTVQLPDAVQRSQPAGRRSEHRGPAPARHAGWRPEPRSAHRLVLGRRHGGLFTGPDRRRLPVPGEPGIGRVPEPALLDQRDNWRSTLPRGGDSPRQVRPGRLVPGIDPGQPGLGRHRRTRLLPGPRRKPLADRGQQRTVHDYHQGPVQRRPGRGCAAHLGFPERPEPHAAVVGAGARGPDGVVRLPLQAAALPADAARGAAVALPPVRGTPRQPGLGTDSWSPTT